MVAPVQYAGPPPTKVTYFLTSELNPIEDQVAHYAGGSRYRLEEKHRVLVKEVREQAMQICRPAVAHTLHTVLDCHPTTGELLLQSGTRVKMPAPLASNSTRFLAVVVTTLGERLEQISRRLREQGDLLRSVFLDAAGLAMLELLAKAALELISGLARERGLFAGRRIIPGCHYGLDMSVQKTLFQLVDGAAIGVMLKASLVMAPLKSQSFLVAMTSDPAPVWPEHKCVTCPNHDCLYRHTGRVEGPLP